MSDEIIFDAVFTEEEYHVLPNNIQAECVKVVSYENGYSPVRVEGEGGIDGVVIWRGAHVFPDLIAYDGYRYAHRSQHPTSMSASDFIMRSVAVEGLTEEEKPDMVMMAQLVWVEDEEGYALPGWANQTVGEYYTRKLIRVKPYQQEDHTDEVIKRTGWLLRRFFPRVIHPLGFAWISEVRWNKRKEQVEAKVLDARWLPVAHPGQDVEAVMQQLQQQGFVQWDITMVRHPQQQSV